MMKISEMMKRTELDKGEGSSIGGKDDAPDGAFGTDLLVAVAQKQAQKDLLVAVAQREFASNTDSDSDDEPTTGDTSSREEDKMPQSVKIKATASAPDKQRKLGRRAFKKKEFEKAASHFHRAIELNPKETTFYFRLAETRFEQGKYEEVVQFCTKAIKVGKQYRGSVKMVASSQVLRGRARKKQGKGEKAKADVEKAINFLTSIALVKLEKQRYFEALDFINEAYFSSMIVSLIKEENPQWLQSKDKRVALQYKVCLGYLNNYGNSHRPHWQAGELSRFDLSTRQALERNFLGGRIDGDRAFEQNKYQLAITSYCEASLSFANEMTAFLTKQARLAEEGGKWSLCHDLCHLLQCTYASGVIAKEVDAKLTQVRALKGKALRRFRGYGEDIDKKFADILAARGVCNDDKVITEKMKSINQEQGRVVEMADLSGSGKVTVQEYNLFVMCLNDFNDRK